jgi:hypothetical protein
MVFNATFTNISYISNMKQAICFCENTNAIKADSLSFSTSPTTKNITSLTISFTREKILIFIVHNILSGDKRKKIGKFVYIHQPMLKLKTSRLFKRHQRKKIPRCSDKNNAKILDGRNTIFWQGT